MAHHDFLASLSRTLVGDGGEAEDLAQETWLAVLKEPGPRTPNLRAWLASVARNRWRSKQRSEIARRQREFRAARPEALDPGEAQRGLELRKQVIEAVRSLPEPYLTTIYLRYYEQLPIAELATHMGVPLETARSRIQRGVELLRGKLDREFGSRGAWVVALGAWVQPEGLAVSAPAAAAAAATTAAALPAWIVAAGASLLLLALFTLGPWRDDRGPEPLQPAGSSAAAPRTESADPSMGSAARPPAHSAALGASAASGAAPGAGADRPAAAAPASAPAGPTHEPIDYRVFGRVLTASGIPAPGTLVLYGEAEATADAEGRFELVMTVLRLEQEGKLPSTKQPMVAVLQGHSPAVLEDPTAGFSDDPSAPQWLELVLGGPPRALRGRVLRADGAPARGWRVALRDPSFGQAGFEPSDRRTLESMASGQPLLLDVDEDGRFVLQGLRDRPYGVIAWDPASLRNVIVEEIPAALEHLVLTAPAATSEGRVAGRVTSLSGAPLAGARVQGMLEVMREQGSHLPPLTAYGAPVAVDELGHFEFPHGFSTPLRLFVRSERILREGMWFDDMYTGADWQQLVFVLPQRCEVVLDARSAEPPADRLAFVGADGERNLIQLPEEEAAAFGGMAYWRGVFLGPGPSRRVVHTREDSTHALFYDHDGTELERRPVQLSPNSPFVLSW